VVLGPLTGLGDFENAFFILKKLYEYNEGSIEKVFQGVEIV
jgi:hypothetical protein